MDGNSPYPPGYGASPPGGGQRHPPSGPAYLPQAPVSLGAREAPARTRTGLLASAIAVSVLLGVVALVLSILALAASPQPLPEPAVPRAEQERVFVDDADTALCRAIGPLMKESDQTKRAFTDAGPAGSPERTAATPKFKADTLSWANRIQEVLNDHSDPPRYLTRTVQEYIDGMLLYTENITRIANRIHSIKLRGIRRSSPTEVRSGLAKS